MLNTRLIRISIVPLVLFMLLGGLSFLPRPIYAADPGLADIGSDDTPTLTSTVNGMQVGFTKENNKTTIWLRVCADSPNFQLRSEHVGLWITEVFNRTTAENGCSPSPTSWWKMVINADPNPNEVFRIYATANDTLLSESAFMQRAARTECRVTGYGVGYCTPTTLQPVSAQTGYIDQPAVGENVQGTIIVRGWAADAGSLNGSGVSNVQVRINGTLVGSASYGGSRPDVAAYLGDSRFTNTGYQLAVNVSNFPSGSANLQVNYQSAISGVWHSLERQITIANGVYTISGRITDNNGSAISGVMVSDGTRSATTDSNGNYTLTGVPAGSYTLRPSGRCEFSPALRTVNVSSNTVGQNFTQSVCRQYLPLVSRPFGTIVGQVVSAVTGQPLAGVTVCVVSTSQCVTTNSQGNYTFTNLTNNPGSIRATATGYVSLTQDVVDPGTSTTTTLHFALSPYLAQGDMRIVLTWDTNPRDLDSHLWLPNNAYHIYYPLANKGNCFSYPYACLDVDDQYSYGPETITIKQRYSGTYTYAVHLYAGTGSLPTSGAWVRVYTSQGLVASYAVPSSGEGRWWHVFDLNGTTITPRNYISSYSP